ncbi:alpha-sarcoglycan-like isoform X2 [Anopheles albimanus]|uniref:Dystroglycan-type cadherin-like domain-containing protein n=1 Tax=Anopheles albimanus TaxID=7167 RepID=A0A182FZS3_ANOAL|nr:alpha-sarcoglycan-like isoform X2 [Anopheles albimanus]
MEKTMAILVLLAAVLLPCCSGTETIYITDDVSVSELFSLRIEPRMFNWSYEGLSEQFHYRSSLEGYPDLPSWIRYMYSPEYHSGFLYGTPPPRTADTRVPIEIIALNRMSYETKRLVLILAVHHKPVAKHVIQMKIDNLNWVHMMDPGRIENLKNIFRNDLWPESRSDLHIIFMDSAVKLGARLPLRPQQREGVVVHIGSRAEFSGRMLDLQEEVKPLYKIASCTYKRTSVQTTFENSGFKLDWCAFRLTSSDDDITALPHHPNESHKHGDHTNLNGQHVERWDAPLKSEIPERNYSDEVAISFAIPGMIFALLLCGLTIILCFQHEKLQDDDSEYYFNYIFYICSDFLRMHKSSRHEYNMVPSNVQMVHYSPEDAHSTIKLKSLRDAPFDVDPQRISPSDSYYREGSPHISNMYMRPKPPPYKLTGTSSGSPTLNRNHADNGAM